MRIRETFAPISLFLAFLSLAACSGAPAYQSTDYVLPVTPGGRMCADQCTKSRDFCRESCDLDNRACFNDVQAAAQREYDDYARSRFTLHLPVDRWPSDFEHPESCLAAKKSCFQDCDKPYNVCYKACGGSVAVTTSCQFLCFQ